MKCRQGSKQVVLGLFASLFLSNCVGTIVGAAVDTTIEVAKVPFKVAGAAIDVATPDKDDDEN
jgi:purine-cytosine permease-like protein